MRSLSEKDYRILDVLKENSVLSIQQIAKKTGIPAATVHNHIKRLKAERIITKYTIKLDYAKLGRKMVAYILIKATPKSDHIRLLHAITKNPAVEFGSAVSGPFDLVIVVRVADIDELNSIVLKYLRTFDAVAETQTMIAFESVEK